MKTLLNDVACLNKTLEGLNHGLTITDKNGHIQYYSPSQGRIDGLEQNQVLGHHVSEVYVPALENSPTLAVIRTGEPIYDLFYIYETRAGKVVNSSHTVLPMFENGKVAGAICIIEPLRATGTDGGDNASAGRETVMFENLIGSSHTFRSAVNAALSAADSPSSILIYGETGSGKELLARQLHINSQRAHKPYVAINCSAIPATLLEGTLFGSVKGAFTGAQNTPGLFESAHGGTVYLDEVDSMPLELQPKLLRAIQERKVRRVGAIEEIGIDIKLISSFSAEPLEAVKSGRVRADLFYRLGVVIIQIPPLRERLSDLPGLVSFFINKHQSLLNKKISGLTPEVMDVFKSYHWPGNVRELENTIEGALNIVEPGRLLGLGQLPPYFGRFRYDLAARAASAPAQVAAPLQPPGAAVGRRDIEAAMIQAKGSVTKAASALGLSRQTLSYRLKKYGLNRQDFDR